MPTRSKEKLASPLRAGDLIEVVAPSSPFDRAKLAGAVRWLRARGYRVKWSGGIFSREGYLAGSDRRRRTELERALSNKESKAVWLARGGYGASRLLLDGFSGRFVRKPKLLIGLSDATVLLNEISARANLVTVHGPVLAGDTFARLKDGERRRLMMELEKPLPKILHGGRDFSIWRAGSAQGRLFGGNLAMVEAVLGTKYEVPFKGGFLFLEEVNEPRYRVDRMLTHLALAGAFAKIRALLLGEFWDETGKPHDSSWLKKLVLQFTERTRIPVIAGIPAGHGHNRVWLPIGGKCRLEARARRLRLSAVVK